MKISNFVRYVFAKLFDHEGDSPVQATTVSLDSPVLPTTVSLDLPVQATPQVQIHLNLGSQQKFCTHKISSVQATPRSLDSQVQPTPVSHQSNLQGLPMLLMEQFLKKQTVGVKYRLNGRVSCFKFFLTLLILIESPVYPTHRGVDLKCK